MTTDNSRRRIVITGMGVVSAAGVGAANLWAAAKSGGSCIRELKLARPYTGRIKIAAQVPEFDPARYIEAALLPYCDPFTQFSIVAADEAVAQAGFAGKDIGGPRTAVVIGTGIGGATTIDETSYGEYAEGKRPDTLSVPRLIPSAAPTTLGMRYGAKGPTFALASACSSATQAIGEAFEMLRAGRADRAIAGGAEACVTNGGMRAWEALRVLTPDLCRPFSAKRNGMTLGEGAAVFVLETLESAQARGATPLCELAGYGTTSDAFDPLRADVDGPARCMRLALESAGLEPSAVDYLNAHGTATYANDITESEAMRVVFGDRPPPVSSTKPIHGHALGASGGLELSVTINALREQLAPPTINFLEPDPKCPVDAIPNAARKMRIRVALSNSFAFGGINATLAVRAL
ncbi:beta-ketoacyl-[acyl-carrier-protein] synthase family protein [Methylocystis echinoides]|nr:beta-ketoacyl-[acyl-carrier-protein] synthase family protein [Methylocystis echinoides]